jgi:esterase/lipase superfamily enzyme
MVAKAGPLEYRMWLFNQFHHAVRHEIVPAIRADMGGDETPIVVSGASIGAFNALAVLCRFPDVFRAAVGMSGTYRIQRFLDHQSSPDLFFASPLDFLPGLEGEQLDLLRSRFAIIATGQGAWEDVDASWDAGAVLGSKGVPNRVDVWGPEWPHDWETWQRMLPQYLDELC